MSKFIIPLRQDEVSNTVLWPYTVAGYVSHQIRMEKILLPLDYVIGEDDKYFSYDELGHDSIIDYIYFDYHSNERLKASEDE